MTIGYLYVTDRRTDRQLALAIPRSVTLRAVKMAGDALGLQITKIINVCQIVWFKKIQTI